MYRIRFPKDVSQKHTEADTFFIWNNAIKENNRTVASVLECLFIYQEAYQNTDVPPSFVVSLPYFSRRRAGKFMGLLESRIRNAVQHENLIYTVGWWWRTPSSAGTGPLRIGFRILGISEMVETNARTFTFNP